MKNSPIINLKLLFLLISCSLIYNVSFSQSPPNLGRASSFTLFTSAGAFSNTGATNIKGDIGTNVGAFTGFPPGTVVGQTHIADSVSAKAATDLGVAYSYLSGITCGIVLGTTLGNNQVLTPNVYCLGAASTLNGDLYLNGQGNPNAIFIIKINGAFATSTHTNIILINSASFGNVYWQVNGKFTLGDSSVFKGTLISDGAITLLEGSTLLGRGLSVAGAISLHNNVVATGMQPIVTIAAGSKTTFCSGDSVTLSATVTHGIGPFSYVWSPGGKTDSFITVSPLLNTLYKVSVTSMYNYSAVKDSLLVSINPLPTVTANATATRVCSGTSVILTGGGATSYVWTAGVTDGIGFIPSVTKIYTVTGTNSNGCKNTATKKVTVNTMPVTGFSINNAAQCLSGNHFVFTNSSTVGAGSLTYAWTFGDASTSTLTNPTHNYLTSNTFNVRLIATSDSSCKDTVTLPVSVSPKPVSGFSINDAGQCLFGNHFVFTNSSTVGAGSLTYSWTFGDAATSTLTNPTHNYLTANTFNVRLIASAGGGCNDTITKSVTANPMPVTGFSINNAAQCLSGNHFVFTNSTSITSGTLTYAWTFGDASTSTLTNPTHNYLTSNTFNVRLIATSDSSCKDTVTLPVTVSPKPVSGFSINDAGQCLRGNHFVFTNSSTVGAGSLTYAWTFGDAGTSTLTNPTHNYLTANTFNVRLIASAGGSCNDTITKTVTVNTMPVTGFSINNAAQCLSGNHFVFTNSTSITSGTLTYAWTFGDAATSTLTNPTHNYLTSNTFSVRLIATSDSSCKDTVTLPVTVSPKPVSGFSINDAGQCLRGNNFVFTNSSTVGAGSLTYAWTFGDAATSTLTNPTHNYLTANTFNVRLIASAGGGCNDTITKSVTANPMPVTGFSINNAAQCLSGNHFVFTNSTSITSGTLTYAWTFGDASTSTLTNPTHNYLTSNTFNVRLIATSDSSCKDTVTLPVTVSPKPVSGFSINDAGQCLRGNHFVFTNSSTVGAGSLTYAWTFGDAGTSTLTNPTHNYLTANTFNVRLIASAGGSCNDTITKTVTVNTMPVTGFSINNAAQCLSGNHFVFTNSSTVGAGSLTYAWTFGDASTSTLTNPTHNYLTSNTFSVRLIAISDSSCKDTVTTPVTVSPKPVSGFSINDAGQCLRGNNFVFTNSSTVGAGSLTYAWTFGDAGTSTLTNPTHNYLTANTFNVRLIASAGGGCNDTITKSVTANPMPVTGFSINNAAQCLSGNHFVFTNSTSITSGTLTYAWTFGDASTSTLINPTHNYLTSNTFNVRLIATSDSSCKDTVTLPVSVSPKPVSGFSINDAGQCLFGNHFVFTNSSTVGAGSLTYAWTFGDAGTSTLTNPTHNYLTANTFNVRLIASAGAGCNDTITKSVTVNTMPVAAYSINDAGQCLHGNNFVFTNGSTVSSGSLSYAWNFGDAGTSTSNNPSHSYLVSNTYNVSLIVTSDSGCKDTITKPVKANPMPVAAYSINDAGQCLRGNNFVFTNGSTVSSGNLTYAWNFGDAGTSTSNNPSHSYLVSNTYNVRLIVTSDSGCKDTITKPVKANPMPVAAYSINDAGQCLRGNSFVFTNGSTVSSGSLTYAWNFGDAGTSTSNNPSHSYLAANTYNVRLIVTSDSGCKDTITKPVKANPMPVAAYTINDAGQCLHGNNFVFTNGSTVSSGSLSYAWNFGDAGTSTSNNPSHSYLVSNTYNVRLIVTSDSGCKDTITKPVKANPMPVAAYSINDAGQCLRGNNFVFTNGSTVSSGNLTYAWNFGDAGTSTSNNPSHSYLAANTYNVRLIVTSDSGCKDTITKPVKANPMPVAAYSINDAGQCLHGNNFVFTNGSTVSSGSLSYAWNFGDAGTSTSNNPSHSYLVSNTYNVRLIVTSDSGCKDTITKPVKANPMPVAAYSINDAGQCLRGNNFVFTNGSTVSSGNLTYAWNFGDAGTSTSNNPSHSYLAANTYNVRLIVTSDSGCKDTITKPVKANPMPVAAYSINDAGQCLRGNSFVFTNGSTVSSGNLTYAWNFGDAGTSTSNNPSHSYLVSNTYNVRLIVTSDSGCKDTITKPVKANPMPVAAYTINDAGQCLHGNNFVFTNGSTVSSGSLSYAWNFGDAGTSTSNNPSHSYLAANTYNVRLIVTSDSGCKDTITKPVKANPMPVAAYSINDAGQCLHGNNFVFTNGSTVSSGSLSYAWNFGDAGTSTSNNPSHSYLVSNTYNVSLIVTSDSGCKDTITKPVKANPMPVAAYSINDAGQCLRGNNFVFTNGSTVSSGNLTYAWNFGDAGTSTSNNPSHSYLAANTYNVRLIVTSDSGCKDTITKPVKANPMPVAAYSINDAGQCLHGNNFVFTNGSTVSSGSLSYAWNFGDAGTSTSNNPSHSYLVSNTYNVRLIVTSDSGCKDTITKPVKANPMPVAAYSINDAGQCLRGNNFVFTNGSTVSSGNLTYAWNFGDAGTSTSNNPSHSYLVSNTYNVRLIVTSDSGCKDTITKPVKANPMPVAAYTINDAGQCLRGNNFVFTNGSTVSSGSLTYTWNFGDAGTSTSNNPSHSYLVSNTYNVRLIVTSDSGCKDTITKQVKANPMPVAAYSINDAGQCLRGNNFVFTNGSTVSSGSLTYTWNFGDAGTSTSNNPSHSYLVSNTYNVSLIVTSDSGCKDTITKPVKANPMPVAAYSINDAGQCLRGNNFVFTNGSTVSSGNLTYAWNFGDAGTSTSNNPSHSYLAANTYNVRLIVTSDSGCKDTITKPVKANPMPVAAYSINDAGQCLHGNNFVFTNGSTVSSGSLSYAWNFGDAGTSTSNNPSHSYLVSNTYNVRLIVTSDSGCKDTITKPVKANPMPVAAYSINDAGQCLRGNNFVFTNGSTVSSGNLTYAWNFGDAGTSTSNNPSHSYLVSNTYNVRLIVTSDSGCKDTITKPVKANPMPVAAYSINDAGQCLRGNSFVFTNGSTVSSGSLTYTWNFGDAGTSTSNNPSHSYLAANTYNVRLIVTSDSGCKDTITKPVKANPMPVAAYSINDAGQCLRGNSFVFTNASAITSGSLTYAWNFGDAGTSTSKNSSHSYIAAYTYNVKLIVSSDSGCKDTITKMIRTHPMPVSAYSINDAGQCLIGNNFVFTNGSTVGSGSLTYAWNFGDAGTSTSNNPSHSYLIANTYNVRLIVTSDSACKDTITKMVKVNPMPVAAYIINDTSQCLKGNNFIFTNASTVSSGSLTYTWNFGDTGTSTSISPAYSYMAANTYNVRLIATSDNGCKDTIIKTVIINLMPIVTACWCPCPFVVCAGTRITLTGGGAVSYIWTGGITNGIGFFPDSTTKYTVTGNDSNGCKNNASITIYVNPLPKVTANASSTKVCDGTTVILTGGGAVSYVWTGGVTNGTGFIPSYSNTYMVTGTDSNGCKNTAASFIVVNPIPVAVANSNSPVCAGNSIILTAQTVTGGSYIWTGPNGYSSPVQDPVILTASLTDAGNYSLIVSNNSCISAPSTVAVVVNNCNVDLSIVKTVNNIHPLIGQNVVFTITATNNGVDVGTGIIVTDILQGGYTFVSTTTKGTYNPVNGVWTIGNLNVGESESFTITVKVNSTGNYIDTSRVKGNEEDGNLNNNLSWIETNPTDFFIPEGFSPNGDGINDLFVIRGLEIYPDNTFTVFNRWGNKVFDANHYQNTWDGRSTTGLRVGNSELPIGTYFYLLDLKNGSDILKGTIYLNR